jgi:hypothetical protein
MFIIINNLLTQNFTGANVSHLSFHNNVINDV